ncbi:hypothetical protein BDR05DRAFT_968867 [Suillus weaverae]|nr:hypothetical protein BDR05DRAFT_968867 [Suillus weaverae]
MPPTETQKTQSRKFASAGPLDSTCNPKSKSHRTVKLETQEATIPSQNSSLPPAPAINKPRSKAYYAIKSKPQEDRSPSPKATVPYITLAAREELWVIWKSDPRVPTIASRHAWAASRNVSPLRVDQWFCSRKSQAKKLGQPISNDSYELSLEPRAVPVKHEVQREPLSPSPACSDKTDINSPSDDTLVSFGAHSSDASPRSSVPALSMTPEPTRGNLYLLHEVQNSSPVSRTLIVTPEANKEHDTGYSKDLYRYALSKRVWCLSDAYTHIATA